MKKVYCYCGCLLLRRRGTACSCKNTIRSSRYWRSTVALSFENTLQLPSKSFLLPAPMGRGTNSASIPQSARHTASAAGSFRRGKSLLHTPSIAFRHLPPCRKPVLGVCLYYWRRRHSLQSGSCGTGCGRPLRPTILCPHRRPMLLTEHAVSALLKASSVQPTRRAFAYIQRSPHSSVKKKPRAYIYIYIILTMSVEAYIVRHCPLQFSRPPPAFLTT